MFKYLDICPSWRCNARCSTCGAWKRDQKTEISRNQINRIVESELFKGLEYIVIEGGEPFVWTNLEYFVSKMVRQDRMISIITNGLNTPRITDFAKTFNYANKNINFLLSLNGIGEIHDKSRGVKGAYDKLMKSMVALKESGFGISFSYVPFKENADHYIKVFELSKRLGIGMGVCWPSSSAKFGENITWNNLDKSQVIQMRRHQMENVPIPKSIRGKARLLKAKLTNEYFMDCAINKKLMPCDAGTSMAHINPEGKIRPCHLDESMILGVVTDDNIVMKNPEAYNMEIENIPKKCQFKTDEVCNDCYLTYTAKNKPLTLLKWRIKKALNIKNILGKIRTIKKSFTSKQDSEINFWKGVLIDFYKWYSGELPIYNNAPSPKKSEKVKSDTLAKSVILTIRKLYSEKKYLSDLGLKFDAFNGMKLLEIGSGPISGATCFKGTELHCLEPLLDRYERIGFPVFLNNIKYIHSSAESIPCRNNFFDAVISINAIDHVDDISKTALEIKRVLRPDGLFRMHVHYHKPQKCEPISLDDDKFIKLFGWVENLKKVKESTTSFSNNVPLPIGEKFVLWSNF